MNCICCFVAFFSFIALKMDYTFATSDGRTKRSSSSSSCDASWVIRPETGSDGGQVETTIVDQTECLSHCLHNASCFAVDIRQMTTTPSSASREREPVTIECRVHERLGQLLLDRRTIPGSVQHEVLKRCGSHPHCAPLWLERYNMRGANGVLVNDLFGIESCKSACVNNSACTSLHVYLNPRKGPTECWLNYDPRDGSSDPTIQSVRYLHFSLVDRCGASSQHPFQEEKLVMPTTTLPVRLKPPITITFRDINIIVVSWACITAVAVLSAVLLYRFKIRSMEDASSSQQSFPEDDELLRTVDELYIRP